MRAGHESLQHILRKRLAGLPKWEWTWDPVNLGCELEALVVAPIMSESLVYMLPRRGRITNIQSYIACIMYKCRYTYP